MAAQQTPSRLVPQHWKPCALAALSGVLISLPFLFPTAFLAGWIALVPLLFALQGRGLLGAWTLGLVTGLVTWMLGSYWMANLFSLFQGYSAPWNTLAASVYWLYAAHGFAIAALLLQWARRYTTLPDTVLVPLVVVGVLELFPVLFPLRPGEAQTLFLPAIQATDIGGVQALDLVMALASALIYACLRPRKCRGHSISQLLATGLLAAWFGYGLIALHHWDETVGGWETTRVGIVQPNDAPNQGIPALPEGYTRLNPPEMEQTRGLADAGAELVVWPESRFKGYYRYPVVRRHYQRAVKKLGVTLAFQDSEAIENGDQVRHYNTATVLNPQGQHAGHYRKARRMPFGEYLPLADTIPWLRPAAEAYFGNFMETLAAGETPASITADGRRLIPRICYESAFPALIASGFRTEASGGVLIIHSMNNWFGESRQPAMHLRASILRAVENRVPMVHAINNGPSALVRPDGRVIASAAPFTRGTLLADLPHSEATGSSVYNRFPKAVPLAVRGLLALLIVAGIAGCYSHRPRKRRFTETAK